MSIGAALTTQPFASVASQLKSKALKVGILLPTSTRYQNYSDSFQNGVHLVFDRFSSDNLSIEPTTEIVKFGYPSQVIKKTRKLIEVNRVDQLIGIVNTQVADRIGEISGPAKIPTFIANAGENIPTKAMLSNPNMFFSSLDLCKNSALAGKYMVENFGKDVTIISDIYDCGYDTIKTLQNAIERSGGNISKVYINNRRSNDFFERTTEELSKNSCNSIFLLMNGKEAASFLQAYQTKGIRKPLVTTSLVTDECQSLHLGASANNLLTISSWAKSLDTPENKLFVSAYRELYSAEPDQFAFLGYQTGKNAYCPATQQFGFKAKRK